jgi:hypothetical protein
MAMPSMCLSITGGRVPRVPGDVPDERVAVRGQRVVPLLRAARRSGRVGRTVAATPPRPLADLLRHAGHTAALAPSADRPPLDLPAQPRPSPGGSGSPREHPVRQVVPLSEGSPAGTDMPAVTAGLTLPYGNGPTEGANTRVKLLERQMHGRAGFALLRQRILRSWITGVWPLTFSRLC